MDLCVGWCGSNGYGHRQECLCHFAGTCIGMATIKNIENPHASTACGAPTGQKQIQNPHPWNAKGAAPVCAVCKVGVGG